MIRRLLLPPLLLGALSVCVLAAPAPASADGAPAWQLIQTPLPTNFIPGTIGGSYGPMYLIVATNVGGAPTSGPITFHDTLPAGIVPTNVYSTESNGAEGLACTIAGQEVELLRLSSYPPGASP